MLFPGYSYDTAYVEFLNLEDAVHFMESNQVAHPCPSTAAVSSKEEGLGWAGRGQGRDGWLTSDGMGRENHISQKKKLGVNGF